MGLQALREKRNQLVASMRNILDAATTENRDLSAEESANYEALDKQLDGLNAQILRVEKLEETERAMEKADASVGQRQMAGRIAEPAVKEFDSFGEFLAAVRFHPNDQRLEYVEPDRRSEQRMDQGNAGGFAVPTQFRSDLLSVEQQGAIIRPRATVIPAGSPADAQITMPALDQGAAQNMYGGVDVSWIGEGDTKPETDFRLREVSLTPKEVAAHIVLTDKLLRNWTAAGALAGSLLRKAIGAAEDAAFMAGNGVARPLGVLASAATFNVNRAVANQIAYADVIAMYARAKLGGNLVWIGSQSILPQLQTMVDAGNTHVWQPNAREGAPGTLLGIPVIFSERSPILGVRGDLMLVDLDYYLIKDGSGLFVSASEHVLFRQNKTVIKAFWNVDGAPWLTAPLTQEGGYQVSPFVVLDTP